MFRKIPFLNLPKGFYYLISILIILKKKTIYLINLKKENINKMFYKKIEEFVNRNVEKDKRFNDELREKYIKFEASVTKF